jgi:hypothetical protein
MEVQVAVAVHADGNGRRQVEIPPGVVRRHRATAEHAEEGVGLDVAAELVAVPPGHFVFFFMVRFQDFGGARLRRLFGLVLDQLGIHGRPVVMHQLVHQGFEFGDPRFERGDACFGFHAARLGFRLMRRGLCECAVAHAAGEGDRQRDPRKQVSCRLSGHGRPTGQVMLTGSGRRAASRLDATV